MIIDKETALRLHANHHELLGIEDTMTLAHAYNLKKYSNEARTRKELFLNDFDTLLQENDPISRPGLKMEDGWARDDSHMLPHLNKILDAASRIISERSGQRTSDKGAYRSYFQDIWNTTTDPWDYPEFLDFGTSSDLLYTVCHYLQTIPVLSTTLPSGIRFVESNHAFDDKPDTPHDSQLFHIDYYSLPNVYVLVLLEDTTEENGPWKFIPKAASQRIKEELGYWRTRKGYRISDEDIFNHIAEDEVISFTGKQGSVLFIESSGCLHYGSRRSVKPRFQLMLGYTGVCRTDFSQLIMEEKVYPENKSDSTLRKLILNDKYLPRN